MALQLQGERAREPVAGPAWWGGMTTWRCARSSSAGNEAPVGLFDRSHLFPCPGDGQAGRETRCPVTRLGLSTGCHSFVFRDCNSNHTASF